VEVKWTRSATRHRISRERSGYVVLATTSVLLCEPRPGADDRLVYLGPDQDGVVLEVMAVAIETGLLIIHAMPIRNRYKTYYLAEKERDSDD
jgi:hypothetical protein